MKYRKTPEGINIMFTNDTLSCGCVQTVSHNHLKYFLEQSGWGNVLGFRVTSKGIEVVTDKMDDVSSSWKRYKKTFNMT